MINAHKFTNVKVHEQYMYMQYLYVLAAETSHLEHDCFETQPG